MSTRRKARSYKLDTGLDDCGIRIADFGIKIINPMTEPSQWAKQFWSLRFDIYLEFAA